MSILDQTAENVDYIQNFRKCPFGTTFANISILVKIVQKKSILVNIYENLDFGQNLWKSRFWSKLSENLDLGQQFRKISIVVNISVKIDLRQNVPQILVLVKIAEKCRLGSKFENMSILVKNFQKSRFWSRFLEISILVKIVKKSQIWSNLDFGHICRTSRFRSKSTDMSIWVKR